MDKDAVAEVLKEIGVLLELKGENPFKTRAYVNGARTLEGLTEPLETLIEEERLGEIKGIGNALVEKITELVETGELEYYNTLKASIPPGLIEMLDVQGMGPKKVKAINEKLGVETIEELEKACETGKVAELDGFGAKSQEKILESIAFKRQHASHHHRHKMLIAAEPILDDLRSHPDVIRCDIAGSLRRGKEVSGDIDFLVSAKDSADIMEAFTTRDSILSVLAAGDTFRAAAVEQLQVWGERAGVPVLTAPEGSDPASLAFDAMTQAQEDGADLLMIDTAGRLQNRADLMEELAKIVRVIRKKDETAPHNTLLVLDATTGQNALSQVETFQKLADVSGLVMTKLDGTAKGGVLVALADKFGLPIHAIGVGEQIDDLDAFDPEDFAAALTGLQG